MQGAAAVEGEEVVGARMATPPIADDDGVCVGHRSNSISK